MIAIDLPDNLEERLRLALGGDLDQIARHAIAVEGYRRKALSIGQVARLLNTSIDAAYGVLKERGIPANYDQADADADLACLKMLFPAAPL